MAYDAGIAMDTRNISDDLKSGIELHHEGKADVGGEER